MQISWFFNLLALVVNIEQSEQYRIFMNALEYRNQIFECAVETVDGVTER